jgi:prefoldin subunit 5
MYYNTTNETKETVKKFQKINNGQDKKVLNIIKQLDKPFSASLIWNTPYKWVNPPITSIRRSINTLKNLELIEETGKRVPGLYGRTELQYKLSDN